MYEKTRQDDYPDADIDEALLSSPIRSQSKSLVPLLAKVLIALGVCIVLLLAVLVEVNFEIKWKLDRGEKNGFRTPVMELPKEVRIFDHSDLYNAPRSNESDEAWMALAGPTNFKHPWSQQGFITLHNKDWEQYELGPGAPVNHGQGMKYGISMFHQLHCLAQIRMLFYDMLDGSFDKEKFLNSDGDTSSPEFVPQGHGLWHTQHCFNYIRQGLQCAGDMSLEWATYFNGSTPIVVGWDTPHQCRSYEAAWKFVEENS